MDNEINQNLMTKLAICNMCYIDEDTCAFREYYYKGTYSTEESKEIRKLYFTKLPKPFNSKVIKSWNEAGLTDTLGSRIKFLQRWFIELCEKHKEEIKMEKILVKNLAQKLQGYNKLIAQPKTNANSVKTCYNYGLFNIVYTYDGEEISGMPDLHKAFITYKRVTKGNLFYIKFYTSPTEILYEEIKPPIQVVKIGLTLS